jgi:UDP-N-acetylglucosamine acyltransferase
MAQVIPAESAIGAGVDGYVSPLALVGAPPEHRDHHPGDPFFAPAIAASARIEAFVTVDGGLRGPTRVGARTWLMKKVHVGHDAELGADCEVAPLTSIGGHVRIGDGVRIGQGAVFRPFVTVGDGARIGAGAVVVKNVPAGETWVGNPAGPIGIPRLDELGPWREHFDELFGPGA